MNTDELKTIHDRLDAIEAEAKVARDHRDLLRQRLDSFEAELLDYVVEAVGMPTLRSLELGHPPGGGLAGQVLNVQEVLAAFHGELAALGARVDVMLQAGKSAEPWSPSKLDREVEKAMRASLDHLAAVQARAADRAADAVRRAAAPAPPVLQIGARRGLSLVPTDG